MGLVGVTEDEVGSQTHAAVEDTEQMRRLSSPVI